MAANNKDIKTFYDLMEHIQGACDERGVDTNIRRDIEKAIGGRAFNWLTSEFDRQISDRDKRLTQIDNILRGEKPLSTYDDTEYNLHKKRGH